MNFAANEWRASMKRRSGTYKTYVTFTGVRLDCEGMYYAGFPGNQIDPPEPELYEFTYINHKGEDVFSLLGEDNLNALAEMCIANLKERDE